MYERGIPLQYIKWLYAFLQNRQARVRFNNELSYTRKMRQGLPQGSVLAPLVFIFYIDNLASVIPTETLNALFADNIDIKGSGKTIEKTEDKVQRTVDVVGTWKLELNATKSECALFSTYTREAKRKAKIINNNKKIPIQI